MRALPLFHRIAGQKVVVLGEGALAEPKRRLVERAGGAVVADLQEGIDERARLAFIAHQDGALCEADAIRARNAGLLVNVVDRPDLCDFTTPSILERDPVLVAIGTSGASAGLAKQLRLRLETLLPVDLGRLAAKLAELRPRIRMRWPNMGERRQAIDQALSPGGPLDPLVENAAERVEGWIAGQALAAEQSVQHIELASTDPDDLTLRQARLLGSADAILFDPAIPAALLARARADASRIALPHEGELPAGLVIVLSMR